MVGRPRPPLRTRGRGAGLGRRGIAAREPTERRRFEDAQRRFVEGV